MKVTITHKIDNDRANTSHICNEYEDVSDIRVHEQNIYLIFENFDSDNLYISRQGMIKLTLEEE